MQIGISETLINAAKKVTKEERIEALKKGDSLALRIFLKCAFDEAVEYDLPAGTPPYRSSIYLDSYGMLYRLVPEYLRLIRGNAPEMSPKAKDISFMRILETVHPDDAKFLIAVKEKAVEKIYPGIDKQLVEESFGVL